VQLALADDLGAVRLEPAVIASVSEAIQFFVLLRWIASLALAMTVEFKC